MTTYYERPDAHVTDLIMEVGGVVYRIADIGGVRVARRSVDSGGRLGTFTVTLLIPLFAIGLVAAGLPATMFLPVFATGAAVMVVVGLVWAQRRHRVYELWISYRGATRRVYRSDEEWRVNQLARALEKARTERRLRARRANAPDRPAA